MKTGFLKSRSLRAWFVLFLAGVMAFAPASVALTAEEAARGNRSHPTGNAILAPSAPSALTLNVTKTTDTNDGVCNADCSLREAVAAANAAASTTGSPHIINIPAGAYNLSLGELAVGNGTNHGTSFVGAGQANTIIRQSAATCTSGTARVFDLDPSVVGGFAASFSNLTISNGAAQAFGGGAILGGGTGDSLNLTNVTISGNCTSGGNNAAGISWSPSGNVTINNSTFTNNASGSGAGVILFTADNASSLTINNSVFMTNTAAATGSAGGALFLGCNATCAVFNINGSTFINNQATNAAGIGGAIYLGGGTLNLGNTVTNRFVNNVAGITASSGLGVRGGTANANNNWWGCNGGPTSGTGCSKVDNSGGTLFNSSWVVLKTTASPASIAGGGSSTLTTSFLQNNLGGALTAGFVAPLIGRPVSWINAANGTFSGQQTSIQSGGTATATMTNTVCATMSGQAVVDNVQNGDATATASVAVSCADVVISKSNNVTGTVMQGQGWNWTLRITNTGSVAASFSSGQTIVQDDLDNSGGVTYGAPAASNFSGVTNSANISCSISGGSTLTCIASGAVVSLGATNGSFQVVIPVTAVLAGAYTNPRSGGLCKVDPNNVLVESNEANNNCAANTVVVITPTPTPVLKRLFLPNTMRGGSSVW